LDNTRCPRRDHDRFRWSEGEPGSVAGLDQPGNRCCQRHLILDTALAAGQLRRRTFYEWRAKGKAPRCITLPNGSLRIRRSEYQRWLAAREEAA
jgi:predicted DNA-binding transcriptional regulator AlpA